MSDLAYMYLKAGYGLRRDVDRGLYWLERAGKKGDVQAQYVLGVIYAQGGIKGWFSISADVNQGEYWLEQAAQKGHKEAKELLESLNKSGCLVWLTLPLGLVSGLLYYFFT